MQAPRSTGPGCPTHPRGPGRPPMANAWRGDVAFPVPMSMSRQLRLSMGGSPCAAAVWSVGSTCSSCQWHRSCLVKRSPRAARKRRMERRRGHHTQRHQQRVRWASTPGRTAADLGHRRQGREPVRGVDVPIAPRAALARRDGAAARKRDDTNPAFEGGCFAAAQRVVVGSAAKVEAGGAEPGTTLGAWGEKDGMAMCGCGVAWRCVCVSPPGNAGQRGPALAAGATWARLPHWHAETSLIG